MPSLPALPRARAGDFLLSGPCHFSTWQVGPAEEASISPTDYNCSLVFQAFQSTSQVLWVMRTLPQLTSCCPHPPLHLCAHNFSSVDHPAFSSLIFKNMRSPQKVRPTKSTAAFSPLPPLRTSTREASGPLSESLWKFHKLNHKQREENQIRWLIKGAGYGLFTLLTKRILIN